MKSVLYGYEKSAMDTLEFIGSVRCRRMPNDQTAFDDGSKRSTENGFQ